MTDTTEYKPADNYEELMRERHKTSREIVKALSTDNPLAGLTPAQMHEVNARGRPIQDGLRGAMYVALSRGGDPALSFASALESLLTVFSSMEQTDQTRETIGYLLAIAQAASQSAEGPFGILNGELYLSAMVDTSKEISKTVRAHLGLPETGEIKPDTLIKVMRGSEENKIIDAAHLFRAKGEATTVH